MSRDLRYALVSQYLVTTSILGHKDVSPFGTEVPSSAWNNLRTVDDNGTIKKVVKFDIEHGVPDVIIDAGFSILTLEELEAALPTET